MKFKALLKNIGLDHNSLKVKLWVYFISFAALLMAILWFLQIFFLNNYYQEMKITETKKVAQYIAVQYGSDDFADKVWLTSIKNDMYIHIETMDGTVIFSPSEGDSRPPTYMDVKEMSMVKSELMRHGGNSVSVIIPEMRTDTNTLAYARRLDGSQGNETILYIFSPLYPVSSTVDILRDQLIYVTIISLLLACMISFYLSNRITKPIRNITKQAKNLAIGNYGITFHGGHYTEIKNLANTLTYASIQLEKADSQQKDLIANVSHDLRTPLTMVKSYAEMIRDLSGDVPEKRNSHLRVIIDEADRLNLLVNDLLSLSRMQSGALKLSLGDTDMKELVDAIVLSYALLQEQEGYTIIVDCPQSVSVTADEQKIKQVVSNLINNAVKYCGQDKTVYVSVRENHGKMRCEVTDHGMGIAPEEIEQIWDRYYKASTNHVRTTSGTGLGLSIVKEILTLHEADFGVISELGKGSTFWFELKKTK